MELFEQLIHTQNQVPYRRSTTLLCVWLLVCPLLAFALLSGATAFAAVAAVLLLGSLFPLQRLAVTTRSLAYTLTVAGIAVVIIREVWPIEDEHFFMPAGVAFPLLMILGIAACYFVQHHAVLITIIVLALLAMMVEGSSLKDPDVVRLGLPIKPWGDRFWVYGIFLALQQVAVIPLICRAHGDRRAESLQPLHGWAPRLWQAGAVLLLLLLTGSTCLLINRTYNQLDALFNPMLEAYIRRQGNQAYFAHKVDLRETVSLKDTSRSAKIVARIRSAIPPGYLRVRAYTKYDSGIWYSNDLADTMVQISGDAGLSAKTFVYPGVPQSTPIDRLPAISVFPTAHFPPNALLASGSLAAVELVADRLTTDRDGGLRPKDWDTSGGYTYRVPRIVQDDAYPRPGGAESPYQPDYLELPDAIWADLMLVADEVFLGCKPDPDSILRRVADYLHDNYEYTLDIKATHMSDPVLRFLRRSREGHCELFAASTVLLLRSQGVPARYLTGFISTESHPDSGYWMTRLGDSHAWAEAWSASRQKWVIVESTPASGIPQGESRGSFLSFIWEFPIVLWNEIFSYIKRGHFAEAVKTFLAGIGSLIVWFFWAGPWQAGWTGLVVGLLALYWFQQRRLRQRFHANHPALRPLHACLGRLERQLRRLGIQRAPNASIRDLHELLRRHQASGGQELAQLLLEYEQLRYRPPLPNAAAVREFERRVRALPRSST